MKSSFKSALVGFGVGLAVAGASAQAAVQATQHEHPPSAQMAAPDAMKGARGMEGTRDMHAMMADPAMRQKMMSNMAQCRDMMSMMMEHINHEGMKEDQPAPHKH